MDRGIKIAILCACLLSLGLGIIWNRVIDVVRPEPTAKSDGLEMGPDRISATVGASTESEEAPVEVRGEAPETSGDGDEVVDVSAHLPIEEPKAAADGEWPAEVANFIVDGKYQVQNNDSYWKIAHSRYRFKFLATSKGIDSKDWEKANPKVPSSKLKPGMLLNIPTS